MLAVVSKESKKFSMLDAIAAFFFVKDMRGKFDIALWPAELLIKISREKYVPHYLGDY